MEQALMQRIQKAREEYAGKRRELFACYSHDVQQLVLEASSGKDAVPAADEDSGPESE
jgi:hypothetical protein